MARKIDIDELDEFLEAAFREYSLKLTKTSEPFWFYAWHDEMSGTLRICAAPANCPEELPFSCRLDVHSSPTSISKEFLESNYLDGIPSIELEESSWEDDDVDEDILLTIYVRSI